MGLVGCHCYLKYPHLLFLVPIPLRFGYNLDHNLAAGGFYDQWRLFRILSYLTEHYDTKYLPVAQASVIHSLVDI